MTVNYELVINEYIKDHVDAFPHEEKEARIIASFFNKHFSRNLMQYNNDTERATDFFVACKGFIFLEIIINQGLDEYLPEMKKRMNRLVQNIQIHCKNINDNNVVSLIDTVRLKFSTEYKEPINMEEK